MEKPKRPNYSVPLTIFLVRKFHEELVHSLVSITQWLNIDQEVTISSPSQDICLGFWAQSQIGGKQKAADQ